MGNNYCPNCGKKDLLRCNLKAEAFFALMIDAGCSSNHDSDYCECKGKQKEIGFWYPNDITEDEAEEMGEIEHSIWKVHWAPDRLDCVRFNYAYKVNSDGEIVVKCDNDDYYNITEEFTDAAKEL